MYAKDWNKRLGDGHCETKTSLYESVCPPLSHLEKNTVLAAVHFTGWQNGYNKTCFFFHSFLSAYILEVPLEPCLKSTVWYSTVSWEIRQMYAMFRNDLSVK